MRHEESSIQQSCVKWYRLQHPSKIIAAVPNGARTSALQGAILKGEGMTAGFPDLIVPYPRHGYHGLYIEMKTSKGTVRPEQKTILAELNAQGYLAIICRSFDEFRAVINGYFGSVLSRVPQPYPNPLFIV